MQPSSDLFDLAAVKAPSERVPELDALRGVSVMGLAWMTIVAFAMPYQAYHNPMAYGFEGPPDRWVWLANFVFVEGTFQTLLAMLFGAGCLILIEKQAGQTPRAHGVRMAVLFAIGLIHATLVSSHDLLRGFALAGLVLPLMRGFSPYALYAVGIGLVMGHMGFGMVIFGSGILDFYQGKLGSDASLFAERNFGRDPGAIEYALRLGQEGFVESALRRSASIPAQISGVAATLPLQLAGMAIGMGLWRQGMLAGTWRTFWMQRLAGICALVAVPALLALGWWVSDTGFPGAIVGAAALVLSAPFNIALALAYALLAMALLRSGGAVRARLAAVGRMWLTNYVATSVILATIFASWGLGLFGAVSRAQAFAISFAPMTAIALWSPLWQRWVGQGPLEWIWRAAVRRLS